MTATKSLTPLTSKFKLTIKKLEKNSNSAVYIYFMIEFIVSHEITISVYATDKIGELADSLLKAGVTKIEGFEWTSDEEDDAEEGAIEAGKEKAHDMCFHLGMKLHRIVSIESVE